MQHTVLAAEDFNTIKLSGLLIPESIPAFEADLPQLLDPAKHVIVNCDGLSEISRLWLRPLVQLSKELGKRGFKLRLVSVSHTVDLFLKTEGVASLLPVAPGLKEALAELGIGAKRSLDVNFVNPFLAATVEVLKTQAKTTSVPGKVYVKKPGETNSGDISGVIGLVSQAFSGSVVISFPEFTFLEIVERLFGEKHTTITKEIEDAAAELTNIIFGVAKVSLNEKGYGIQTALPSVICGKGHSVKSAVQGLVVVVPFDSDAGPFFIEISTSG